MAKLKGKELFRLKKEEQGGNIHFLAFLSNGEILRKDVYIATDLLTQKQKKESFGWKLWKKISKSDIGYIKKEFIKKGWEEV